MSRHRRLGRGLADVSHLFLSNPQPDEKVAQDGLRPQWNGIPAVFVTSGSDLLVRAIVALNIAVDLGLRGTRTTLVDADPAAPTAHILAAGAVDSTDGKTSVPLGAGRTLALVHGVREADAETRCAIVNAPAHRWLDAERVDGVRNLLLVTSPSIRECLHGFAIVKRVAAGDAGLRLGIVVADVADDDAGRSLHERLAVVLARHISATAAYCGWLSPRDRTGHSVRGCVPALLASSEPELSERLRRIAAAAAALFDLEVGTPDSESETTIARRLGLTKDETADLLGIMPPHLR